MQTTQPVILVKQEKGGTWKTFQAACLAAYYQHRQIQCRLADADLTEGHLTEIHPETTLIDYNKDGVKRLTELLGTRKPLVIDFGANTSTRDKMLLDVIFEDTRTRRISVLCPFDTDYKSKLFLLEYTKTMPDIPVFGVAICWKDAPPPVPPLGIPESRLMRLPELSRRIINLYNASTPPEKIARGEFAGGCAGVHSPIAIAMRSYLRGVYAQLDRFPELFIPQPIL